MSEFAQTARGMELDFPSSRQRKVQERQQAILSLLRSNGYQSIGDLAQHLDVSIATTRRDLTVLENSGLAVRTHGGALSLSHRSTSHEPTLDDKQRKMVDEKRSIAELAASLVSPGETVLLDSGSTTWHVAQYLKEIRPLSVVSNDLRILWDLANTPGHTLIGTSGVVRSNVFSLLGPQTVEFLSGLNVNWTFLGADALDLGRGITNVNLEEAVVKRSMIRAARRVVVVADHTKFGRTAFAEVCDLHDVEMVVTDRGLSPEVFEEMRNAGVDVRMPDTGLREPAVGKEEGGSAYS